MLNWIQNIGYAIISYFQSHAEVMLQSLEIAGIGMLGIFVVIGIIVIAVLLLNKLGSKN